MNAIAVKRLQGMPTCKQIRRRFGRGMLAYESAKYSFFVEKPDATKGEIEAAMRLIARAVGV